MVARELDRGKDRSKDESVWPGEPVETKANELKQAAALSQVSEAGGLPLMPRLPASRKLVMLGCCAGEGMAVHWPIGEAT